MPSSTRLHHVAFATRDVEATYDFYARKLGMPLVHCENHRNGRGWFRHFFFDMGNGEVLGFFAVENVGEKEGWRSDISTGLGLPVWANHLAFNVENVEAVTAMRRRCEENGVEILMEVDHGWCHSIYMVDPNGIMVEFTTTTRPDLFAQSEAEALRLLRQPAEEFKEEDRKDASSSNVKVNPARLRAAQAAEPRKT